MHAARELNISALNVEVPCYDYVDRSPEEWLQAEVPHDLSRGQQLPLGGDEFHSSEPTRRRDPVSVVGCSMVAT
jgi:hypothetical protein